MKGGWNQSSRNQQDMWESDDYVAKKQHQFKMLKDFSTIEAGNNWNDWDEEKRKRELREMMKIAWYLRLAEAKGLTTDKHYSQV